MIDFTTVPIYEPLPELGQLNYENNLLADKNKVLRRMVFVLGAALLIVWLYRNNRSSKKDE